MTDGSLSAAPCAAVRRSSSNSASGSWLGLQGCNSVFQNTNARVTCRDYPANRFGKSTIAGRRKAFLSEPWNRDAHAAHQHYYLGVRQHGPVGIVGCVPCI